MRFVSDACHDITNIEADRMEIQGDKLMVYSRFDEVNTAAAELIERLTAENADLRKEIEWKDMVIALAQRKQTEAEAERAALREKQRWIPVTERLPERDVQVLGWYKDNPFSQYRHEVVAWNGNGWVFVYAHRYVTNVTHWMPLPDAPEEGGKA